jgi:O-antigen ligase
MLIRALIVVSAGALFTTLSRNLVVSLVIILGMLALTLHTSDRIRLTKNLLGLALSIAGLIIILLLTGLESSVHDYSTVYLERLSRMFSADIVKSGENLAPRWEEIQYAWTAISQHPILGIGLHNTYRPPFYLGEPAGLRTYVHNAYLSLWLKTGLLGLTSFVWLSVAFVKRGCRDWLRVKDDSLRAIYLGCTMAYVGMMISNVVSPSFVQAGSLAILGVILGINEAISIQNRQSRNA